MSQHLSYSTRSTRRVFCALAIGVLFFIASGFFFVLFAPLGGFEGRVSATTRFADGTPAPCIRVAFRQLERKGPENPGRVRAILLLSTSSGQGNWNGGGTWPYGEYQLTAFADRTEETPLASSTFTIWPMWRTEIDLVIDDVYKPVPLPEFPHGCLDALDISIPD